MRMKTVEKILANEGIKYIDKDPVKNFTKLIKWAEKLPMEEINKKQVKKVKALWEDDKNNWHIYIEKLLTDLHPNIRNKTLENLVINSAIIGGRKLKENREKYDCNIPWAILMDPTSACNLKCVGCWAAEYKNNDSLDYETLSSICHQGKELGTYFYLLSGGEPMVRKNDILRLAKDHNDCMFVVFTNGTLFTEEFAKEVHNVGNITFAISIEGYEEETDMRRGKGTYQKVIRGMELLKSYDIGFGFSTCYHSKNVDTIASEEYIDFLIDKGCIFGWFFTYIPVGTDAVPELIATPEQRELMYHKLREYRKTKPLFTIDFWNDGEYSDGCIAGGRNYLHINANGDVEPCAFIHYSNVNIKEVTLLEALHQPLFMKYKENQPFNRNMLRPCPLLDNPNRLKEMVLESGALSTQIMDQESVIDLTDKTQEVAKKWKSTADRLWNNSNPK